MVAEQPSSARQVHLLSCRAPQHSQSLTRDAGSELHVALLSQSCPADRRRGPSKAQSPRLVWMALGRRS